MGKHFSDHPCENSVDVLFSPLSDERCELPPVTLFPSVLLLCEVPSPVRQRRWRPLTLPEGSHHIAVSGFILVY